MGLMNNGILGGFSGKVGTVVGGNWRGKEVMRSKPRRKRKSANPTDAQRDHQAKFTLTAQFTLSMKDLLELGYQNYAKGKTGANSALAVILKRAITGTYPDFRIAYDKVLVSRGSLLNAADGKAVSTIRDTIQFTWTNNEDIGYANANDQVLMVAYCPELGSTAYKTGAPRSAGSDSLLLPGYSGKVMQVWMSFVTSGKDDVATSIYLGEMTIA